TFNKVHNVTALLLYEQSSRNADNFFAQRELSLPVDQLIAGNSLNQQGFMDGNGTSDFYKNTNKAYVGRLTYDYKSKYLAEFSFRDDGSSQFTLNKQWGFFPAGSIGWRVSEEDFWKNSSLGKIVDNLKFRASYGVTGDDSSLGYQFLTGYTYPAGGGNNTLPGGSVFDGTFVNAVNDKGLPNPLITWSTSKTFDVGVDAELMNGLFGFSFDYFRRNRTGLLATEILSLPDVVGTSLPQENLNSDRTQGIDLEITHRNHIGAFNYSVKGTMGFTRTMNVTVVQAKAGNSYLDWRNNQNNRNTGSYWGQGAAGRFTSYGDIINSPTFVGRGALVGDYAYQDYNGDGVIDDNDVHPVAYSGAPLLTYGITLSGSYKGFDFNALFQGTGMVDVSYFEQLNTPLWGGGSALSQFLDRYHPADPKADPYDPKTVWTPGNFAYTGSVPDQNSLFNIQSAAYIRLKSAEIGYTIPNKILSRIGVKGIRVFANGYNIATWTKLKYLDPEHPSSTYGYLYPLDKIFSFGVNVKL
ncbi:MAG: SusC/RagA family TonB-linked outer membrane protein, partial [Mucilaginibacter sp.]